MEQQHLLDHYISLGIRLDEEDYTSYTKSCELNNIEQKENIKPLGGLMQLVAVDPPPPPTSYEKYRLMNHYLDLGIKVERKDL